MIKNLKFLVVLLIAFCAQSVLAQNGDPDLAKEQESKIELLLGVSSQPVVYGAENDGLPRKLTVRGVIKEVTFVPFACGVTCWSGTAKIKLLDKVKGYEPEYVYVTILCFMGEEKNYLNKTVKLKATKLEKEKMPGCEGIVNAIDSKGTAFYKLDKNQSLK